jgi:ABC-type bacteriocin/lantibiotic exporter with double-glycine peptidase domain
MSYSFVRQNDQSDCGAAALATVAMHYGLSIGLQQMRELAGTDRVGTNLLGMVKAAGKIGFMAKAVLATRVTSLLYRSRFLKLDKSERFYLESTMHLKFVARSAVRQQLRSSIACSSSS